MSDGYVGHPARGVESFKELENILLRIARPGRHPRVYMPQTYTKLAQMANVGFHMSKGIDPTGSDADPIAGAFFAERVDQFNSVLNGLVTVLPPSSLETLTTNANRIDIPTMKAGGRSKT